MDQFRGSAWKSDHGYGMMPISDREFEQLRSLIYKRFGIHLTHQKRTLLVSRLQKKMRTDNYESFTEYHRHIVSDTTGQALVDLINLISTNMTYFYREKPHFDFFEQKAFPEIIEHLKSQGKKDIRLWSAGCSTGEEPYLLVMFMYELLGQEYSLWDGGILASDISHKTIKTAQLGIYGDDEINPIPENFREKYFERLEDNKWRIQNFIMKEVTFRHFNLMNKVFPFKKQFQLIFCRNVMIYFDEATRSDLINKFYQSLEPGGYLIIGHSESIGKDNSLFQYVMPSVYMKPF